MTDDTANDPSNGYEAMAHVFMSARNPQIGIEGVRKWTGRLTRGGVVLDLGCGAGVPVSRTLIEEGFVVYGIDASPTLVSAFRERFPTTHVQCADVQDAAYFDRTFDGVIAWGLMFLLPPEAQRAVIRKVASALKPGGSFLFTSPKQQVAWTDALTGRESISLGRVGYQRILNAAGLRLVDEWADEGDNYYYLAAKAASARQVQSPSRVSR